ncbi:class I SAM-dependent methyltransferase [Synechocystis salina]|uniref:Methyltransferase domain-containing protein n=1 Tax=Synechocystis salina LEGE 00031 TaxID=1828736 RepID=A0ABR9VRS4_9SYNC|nr:methyltransferase domain-containing protein [Synechocystis salina]MBE9241029.1 methyltransferase domain-containing protein [Synechocystis salina LEGE 00041]MBE9254065.1 methyltransferase domain-containing protein [Synechocystis salina LEGE 00031]
MGNFQTRSICKSRFKVSLFGILKFESKNFLGRLLFNQKPSLKKTEQNLLHLGCGNTILEGWTNTDFFSFNLFSRSKPDWMLDLRFPLNCPDNTWDGVFTEHTLEHLYPDQASELLQELYRTMKPGAWIRITVPDLQKYVDYYLGKEVNEKFNQWETGCEAIRTLTQDYFHLSLWDSNLLKICLQEVGFVNVQEVDFQQGNNPILLNDGENRLWETLYMEAQKPFN